jgi:predicted nucleotidyltransferase component of viral defense system
VRFLEPEEARAAQEHFGFPRQAPILKDWYVTQALAVLAAIDPAPFRLVFAGGTALARAHRLVQRMSEDADLKIVPGSALPLSASRLRRLLGDFRNRVTAAFQDGGFVFDPSDPSQCRSRDANRYTVYNLPYVDEPDVTQGLRPSIKIELSFSPLRLPPVTMSMRSFVAESFGRPPELPSIDCVSLTETAAEKLVALTRRTAMELARTSLDRDPTLVRHLYDLHHIRPLIVPGKVATLAHEIAVSDGTEFKNQYPTYLTNIIRETQKALKAIAAEPVYRQEYSSFVDSMVYGDRPSFDDAFATVRELSGYFLEAAL